MSQQGPPRRRRRRRSSGAKRVDFWGEQSSLGDPRKIVPAKDAGAFLRSLGSPPLQRHATVGEVYLESVVKSAVGRARALAQIAGVLADGTEEEVR
jgi:hypothetical protein